VDAASVFTFFSFATHLKVNWTVAVVVQQQKQKRDRAIMLSIGVRKAVGDYEELAKDPDVDIVYVSNLHPAHRDTSILMLEHGKHVLCEKPLAVSCLLLLACAKAVKGSTCVAFGSPRRTQCALDLGWKTRSRLKMSAQSGQFSEYQLTHPRA